MNTKVRIWRTNSSRTTASRSPAARIIPSAMPSVRHRRPAPPAPAGILAALLEDALGPEHQDNDQQDEGGGVSPGSAQEEGREALDDPVEQPADHGALHAPQPSEDDDGKG